MKQEVLKGLVGFAIGAGIGITLLKMAKSGKLDIVINEEAIKNLLPKEEKILNPNGEDFTVKKDNKCLIENKEKNNASVLIEHENLDKV